MNSEIVIIVLLVLGVLLLIGGIFTIIYSNKNNVLIGLGATAIIIGCCIGLSTTTIMQMK